MLCFYSGCCFSGVTPAPLIQAQLKERIYCLQKWIWSPGGLGRSSSKGYPNLCQNWISNRSWYIFVALRDYACPCRNISRAVSQQKFHCMKRHYFGMLYHYRKAAFQKLNPDMLYLARILLMKILSPMEISISLIRHCGLAEKMRDTQSALCALKKTNG